MQKFIVIFGEKLISVKILFILFALLDLQL